MKKFKKVALSITLFYLMLFFSGMLSAQITLNVKNQKIRQVIQQIEKSSEYSFFYNNDLTELNNNVNIQLTNSSVENALNELFANTGITYLIKENKQIVLTDRKQATQTTVNQTPQQAITITGTIKDDQGESLPGVSVIVKGTTNGTATDIDGKFSITTSPNAVLVFRYVGFTPQEIKVTGQSALNITLREDAQNLEEVVVVGYTTQKKADLTGAVSSVDMGKLNDMAVTGLNTALQGRMSGVTVLQSSGAPGASSSIRIRGMGTFGNNDPLYIIDGVPADNMDDVSPNDIERVDVLKDAASAAIYGNRAANGVVLIQTKKGSGTGKVSVSLNTHQGFSSPQRKIKLLNAEQRNMIHLEAYENGNYSPDPTKPDAREYYYSDYAKVSRTKWQDEIFTNSAYQGNYDLSVSGASNNARYSIMAGHLTQDGILKNTSFERTSFRVNTELDVLPGLKFGENLMVSHSKRFLVPEMGATGAIATALQFDPSVPVYDETGEYKYSGSGALNADLRNPVGVVDRADRKRTRERILGNVYAEYKFLNDFTFKTDFGYDWSKWNDKWFVSSVPESARRSSTNELTEQGTESRKWLNTTTLRYDKNIGSHKMMVLGGTSYETYRENSSSVRGTNFLNEDKAQRYMEAATQIAWALGERQEWALQSYFGRVDYAFADRYLFTFNMRADGSSRFSKDNRWGYFPSVSGGWRLSEESFFEPLKNSVQQLKLRASWGKLGNQNILDTYYPTRSKIVNTNNDDGYYVVFGKDEVASAGRYESNLPNEDIKWEITTQTNIGLDFVFLNKFDLSLDYYNKKSEDVLLQLPLTSLAGVTVAPWVNSADVRNQGFDANLSYTTKVNNFDIRAFGNIGTVKNKVLSTGSASKAIYPTSYRSQTITRTIAGEPIAHFYGYKTDGIFRSQAEIDSYVNEKGEKLQPSAVPGDVKFVDVDNDGKIDEKDRTKIGSGFPDFTYNFGVDLMYKGFDFSMFFQGVSGVDIFNALKYEGMFMNPMYNQFEGILDRYHETNNPNGKWPRVTTKDTNNNSRMSDLYVDNGNYLRLKTLTIGYTFDKSISKKLRLQKLRVYTTMQNLLTFTSYKGFDPELGDTYSNEPDAVSQPMELGVDRGQFPQPRTFVFGVNINF
ncbi:MAG: SusC/RagA family TonB-linked outer membrane protein [Dysgonomonas sp.]|nr:SusC/RagA family TonB-linked outer membrane protein [Dysgonomonas sp.]